MKKFSFNKLRFHGSTMLAVVFIIFNGCGIGQRADDSKGLAEEHNAAKFIDKGREKDAQFLVNASMINSEEMQLGKLAQERSLTTDVKELGKMMTEMHSRSLNALEKLAGQKNITLPTSSTEETNAATKKLTNKSGIDFDKKYCEMMVNNHKEAITLFENAALESGDSDIKEWTIGMLPVLRTHLDNAITCQKNCEKM